MLKSFYKYIISLFLIASVTYAQVIVTLPEISAKPETSFKLAINVSDLTDKNVKSYYFELNYDTDIIKAKKIIDNNTLSDTRGWDVEGGYTKTGIYIYADGKRALKGSGVLLFIKFEVLADEGSTPLVLDNFYFNNGWPEAKTENGFFRIHVEKEISFNKIGEGNGRFSINGEIFNFPSKVNLLQGVNYTIEALPDANSKFQNWEGLVKSSQNPLVITVEKKSTITANLSKRIFNISAAVEPEGFGLVEGIGTFNYGENIELKAQPFSGKKFVSWKLNGKVISTDSLITVTVDDDKQYTANFEFAFVEVAATSNPIEGGSIIGTGFYYPDQFVQLIAKPNPGYIFTNWTENGEVVSTDTLLTVFVDENKEYEANYSTVTNVAELIEENVPSEFNINNPYPNPFNPSTTFTFSIAEKSKVNLSIYDINGKVVYKAIEDEIYNSGYYSKVIAAEKLSSSIYFFRFDIFPFNGGIIKKTGKLVLLK